MTDSHAEELINEVKATYGLLKRIADHLLEQQNVEAGYVKVPSRMLWPAFFSHPPSNHQSFTETTETVTTETSETRPTGLHVGEPSFEADKVITLLTSIHQLLQAWAGYYTDRVDELVKQGATVRDALTEINEILQSRES